MTAKWKEVSAYTGNPVEEDAPTNFAGQGSGVAMPPDAMMRKKKKKKLLDARTKEYKQHQARLEASRKKRMEQKKSKFIQKVQENLRIAGLVILIFSSLLLVVAIALINNSIRLSIYSRRFIIKSMQYCRCRSSIYDKCLGSR